tara:strand:+ start:1065 stop:3452 length:2388 start_codon:yes stop_codon:yes gene_type:complete
MSQYPFKEIEEKWQNFWKINECHKINFDNSKNKFYNLVMFSYPSGDKLHTGHWYNYGPADTYARFKKMQGYNVFQPQGFDSFGLPAENYAIKHNVHPAESTNNNISKMREQLYKIGAMYDWSQEIITSKPEYYKWTQWLFLKLYENNLAYQKEALVNWDPVDQTVLANEQVLSDGTSERSGAKVIQKPLKQWFFKITKYANELLNFDGVDWPKKTISMQKNWIGKSIGALIEFKVADYNYQIEVFTTRPDTIFGVTYIVLAPEHKFIKSLKINSKKINNYIDDSLSKNELQRMDLNKNKTGIFTGSYAINPVNGKKIPIWIADYVLISYGSGAIMGVPGHDDRDYQFAKKYNLAIDYVVSGKKDNKINEPFYGEGYCINSSFLNGLDTERAKNKIIEWLESNKIGKKKVNFRLRDWLISRQRYWGTPIPIVYDPNGNKHIIPEKYLPWKLPDDVEYKPKGTSPLGSSKELIKRTENIFGKGWRPEIDTMDTFVCSSWYFLRYINSSIKNYPFDGNRLNWLPVDQYIGGAEHATMHLLYSRFITKSLRDMGFLNFDEPFLNLYHQGTITKDGAKMSKSRGNTVSPDEFVIKYGSDTFRAFLMFMGPFDEGGDWNDKGITGIHRFLNKIWRLIHLPNTSKEPTREDLRVLHLTIKVVTEDLSLKKFNTAISRCMEFVNYFSGRNNFYNNFKSSFLKIIAPLVPHLAEELWQYLGNNKSIFEESLPKYENIYLDVEEIKYVVQVNGKLRGEFIVDKSTKRDEILSLAKENSNVKRFLHGKSIIKEVLIPNKLVNLVVL